VEIIQSGEITQERIKEMTEEMLNSGEGGYRTAHLQKKDETYADVIVPADIFYGKIKQKMYQKAV